MLLTTPLFAASLLSAVASASILEIPDLLAARQTNGTDEEAYRTSPSPSKAKLHYEGDQLTLLQSPKSASPTPQLPSYLPARRSSTFNQHAPQTAQRESISSRTRNACAEDLSSQTGSAA